MNPIAYTKCHFCPSLDIHTVSFLITALQTEGGGRETEETSWTGTARDGSFNCREKQFHCPWYSTEETLHDSRGANTHPRVAFCDVTGHRYKPCFACSSFCWECPRRGCKICQCLVMMMHVNGWSPLESQCMMYMFAFSSHFTDLYYGGDHCKVHGWAYMSFVRVLVLSVHTVSWYMYICMMIHYITVNHIHVCISL